jgi:hypothetical protein
MRCLHCSGRIGLIRRLADRQFCCDEHRRRSRLAYSARLARDEEGIEDAWLVSTGTRRRSASFGPGSAIVLVVASLSLAILLPSGTQAPGPPPSYLPPTGAYGDRLSRALPSGSLSIREDFKIDLRNWQSPVTAPEANLPQSWNRTAGGAMRIGELRLWKPTLSLDNYNLEFEAQIEARALGWAYRAVDPDNFYATKIHINKQDGRQRAEIIRYVMDAGRPVAKKQLPIPLVVVENMVYGVRVAVRGDRFVTTVNGQVVDSWSDQRFPRGGVGFFADPGEKALLRWVAVSEPKGMIERLMSFGLIVPPPGMYQ